MPRPQRFAQKLEFWTTPEQCAALDRLEAAGLLNKADHLRAALNWYLTQAGAFTALPAQPVNGQQRERAANGLRS